MPLIPSDIQYRLAAPAASTVGNADAQTNVNDSLGGFMSTTQLVSATLSNLFDPISGVENTASEAEYRCFFVYNTHATLTWSDVRAYIPSQTTGGAIAAIALDTAGIKAANSGVAQAQRIADENTAPTNLVAAFAAPSSYATALTLGDLAPGQERAIWVRRTAQNSAPLAEDGSAIVVAGETSA